MVRWFVPGRVELLGKHTDYAGGLSATIATDRGIRVGAEPISERSVEVHMEGRPPARIPLDPELPRSVGAWHNYPETVVRRLCRDFGQERLAGVRLEMSSDLPPAAGMSSSSALMIATFLGIAELSGLLDEPCFQDPLELAGYLAAIESGKAFGEFAADFGVGTCGGSEDHTAIISARRAHAGLYSYVPTRRLGSARLGEEANFVVASSGVHAAKTGDAMARYNALSRLVEEARLAIACDLDAPVGSLAEGLEHLRQGDRDWSQIEGLTSEHAKRIRHFLAESEDLTPSFFDALQAQDWSTLGDVAAESTRLATELLGNQVPETLRLTELAAKLGAVAATPFGAGFGGSVWTLVLGDPRPFLDAWRREYLQEFPWRANDCEFLAVVASSGAHRLDPNESRLPR